jgi:hypothetical protein
MLFCATGLVVHRFETTKQILEPKMEIDKDTDLNVLTPPGA